MFNQLIIAVDELFYPSGLLLSAVSPIHVVSALSAMMMGVLVIVGLLYRPQDRVLGTVGWIRVLMHWIFATNVVFFTCQAVEAWKALRG